MCVTRNKDGSFSFPAARWILKIREKKRRKENSTAPSQISLKLFRFPMHLPGHTVKKVFFVLIRSFDDIPFSPKSITAFSMISKPSL